MVKKNLLERLRDGIVVGDGGFLFALEKRGYVQAGPWTPEAALESPEAVKQLHREFLRAGADVVQAFTFFASEDKIKAGNAAYSSADINRSACKIAREVANEADALVSGSVSQTTSYLNGKSKEEVVREIREQLQIFLDNDVDFVICEYFEHVEEMEWAIEVCKKHCDKPIATTMCIGPKGDLKGVLPGECAVRMARAGSDVVGINCKFDPFLLLEAMEEMKKALEQANLKPYLMAQPLGFMTPDCTANGYIDLPEFPFAMEPRICTRWEIQKFARKAYELGVKYIGGCCGFEPYHTRAISEELEKEREKVCEASKKHGLWGRALRLSSRPWLQKRAGRDYWENLVPATGRPFSPALFSQNKPNY